MRPVASLLRNRRRCLLLIGALFVLSRLLYARLGVSFDSVPRLFYWQIIDPVLLRDAPWQSLFYLRNQPPLLNVFIAIVVHLFPDHPARAFQPIYEGMGLALAVSLFLLLDRLGVGRPLAVAITAVCAISPVTVLYENWLFYEYPIAALFCVAALFLHRYATGHRTSDGLVFFACLAFLGLFRVIYHLTWFLAIAALLIYALPACRRRTAWCAALPGVLLLAFYVKSLMLFGVWVPGRDVYGTIALTTMAKGDLTKFEIARLAKEGTTSKLLVYDLDQIEKVTPIVPLPRPTGIAILDNPMKSTGVASLDSLWMTDVCEQLHRDALKLLRYRPQGYLMTIRDNIGRYFLPADIGWPFDGRGDTNALVMAPVLRPFDLATTGTIPGHQYAWLSYVTVPLLLGFGFVKSSRWLRQAVRNPAGGARDLTIVFAFANIAWVTGVVIFVDFTDQNRIMFEVFPLFAVLLGCALASIGSRRLSVRLPVGQSQKEDSGRVLQFR
jgi:hypothetical protein